jgi:hypothetical protein
VIGDFEVAKAEGCGYAQLWPEASPVSCWKLQYTQCGFMLGSAEFGVDILVRKADRIALLGMDCLILISSTDSIDDSFFFLIILLLISRSGVADHMTLRDHDHDHSGSIKMSDFD